MTRYQGKHQGFKDEDTLSCGTVQLTEGISMDATHIRYHSVRFITTDPCSNLTVQPKLHTV